MASSESSSTSLTGESVSQKAYTIGGVPIIFPFKAYPAQITMMDKIVKCLNKKHNCLLESPTGTGKSLALLCASLAWLKKTEKENKEMENALNEHLNAYSVAGVDEGANCNTDSVCKLQPSFEMYKFQNDNKKCELKSETLIKFSESNNTTELNTTSELCCNSISNSQLDSKALSPPTYFRNDKLETKSSYFGTNLKRRGIVYTDDDDLNDFQPIKRKLFSDKQPSFQGMTSSQNFKFLTSDIIASKDNLGDDHEINSKYTSNSNSGCASCSKVKPEYEDNTVSKLPKIFYGTRTHKQIDQIIRELRKTPYKDIKMTILSSREKTCIHPVNSKSRNKNEGCDELINGDQGSTCIYFKNVKKISYYQPSELSSAFNLEDLVSMCKRRRICPYFGARELLPNAEIIFCPYNYLLDPLIRDTVKIYLRGQIIIVDEAHNIEDQAREAASSCVSLSQLQEAIADVLQSGQVNEDSEPYMHIAKVLENLKKLLENSQDLNDYVSFDSSCKVRSGDDMLAFLSYVGLGPDTYPIFKKSYSKIVRWETEMGDKGNIEVNGHKLSGLTHGYLKSLCVLFNYMYKENLIYVPDYRCVIMMSRINAGESSTLPFSQRSRRKSSQKAFERTINFWCLNPAVAFSDFKDTHSLILASGTLAPLTSFQSELGIPFQISLETNHVISKDNIWIGSISRGPSNNPLNGNFENAYTFSFQDDIGKLVLEVCSLIPHGVLCFLPSYGMLDKLVNRWQISGLWDKLLCKKVVVCEPRVSNEDFQQKILEFYDAVRDSETNTYGTIRGALFLAVCRGKVSEGFDFADNNARAVITIGIPFPSVKDPQVDLKKKYNNIHSSKRQIVTGSAWYAMQGFRALNQALGRCIRHKNDFGALIIVDERFQKHDSYVTALSKWIRKEIRHYSTFFDALSSLSEFADRMGLKHLSDTE